MVYKMDTILKRATVENWYNRHQTDNSYLNQEHKKQENMEEIIIKSSFLGRWS